MYHEHPLRILRYSVRNIWLLVFPLVRGIRAATLDVDRLYSWIKGAWFDILFLGAILVFGYIRWYFSWISVADSALTHTEGVLVKLKKYIPYENISTVTSEYSFYLRPFGGIRLYCSTGAGKFGKSDMTLMITKSVHERISGAFSDKTETENELYTHNTAMMSVLLFSVFFSSSFSGAVYIAALFFKGGDILRDMISIPLSRITEETARLTDRLIVKVPSAAAAVGAFFLATWFVSFVLNFVRYSGFILKCGSTTAEIECGAFTRRRFRINVNHVTYTDLRQNLIMKIFRAVAVNVSCAGYGSLKKSFPVLLPMKKEENLLCTKENIFRPSLKSFWQYIWLPAIAAIAIVPASYILERTFPTYSAFSHFVIIMTEIPALWMIAVKITALLTSGISVSGDKIVVRYSAGIGFHTIIAERSRLVKYEITQTPFQRISKKCTVSFSFNGAEGNRHYVKAISLGDAEKIKALLDKRRKK